MIVYVRDAGGLMGMVMVDGFPRREVTHVRLYCSQTDTDPVSWGRFHYGISNNGIQCNVPLAEPGYSADNSGFDDGAIDILMVGTRQFGFKRVPDMIQLLRSLCRQYAIAFEKVVPEYGPAFGFGQSAMDVCDIRTILRHE